jgi:hypothetical protein
MDVRILVPSSPKISHVLMFTSIDVSLCAGFMVVNIMASFIQQIHFFTSFEKLQTARYNYQISGNYTGKPAFTGTNTPLDCTLYEIQLYCYNVESLLFLSWIAGLFRHVWRFRFELFDRGGHLVSTTVKIAVIVVPAILIGIANASSVDRTPGVSLILCNILCKSSLHANKQRPTNKISSGW